jgi:hypothetical protein
MSNISAPKSAIAFLFTADVQQPHNHPDCATIMRLLGTRLWGVEGDTNGNVTLTFGETEHCGKSNQNRLHIRPIVRWCTENEMEVCKVPVQEQLPEYVPVFFPANPRPPRRCLPHCSKCGHKHHAMDQRAFCEYCQFVRQSVDENGNA